MLGKGKLKSETLLVGKKEMTLIMEGHKTRALTWSRLFQTLPPAELEPLIVRHLGLKEKQSMRQVCQPWRTFIDETLEFSPVLTDKNAKAVLNLGSTGTPVNTLNISSLETFQYPTEGLGFSEIEEVQIGLSGFVDCKTVKHLLNEYCNILTLGLTSGILPDITFPSFLRQIKLNNLVSLDIRAYEDHGKGYEVVANILKNRFPSLKTIHMLFDNEKNSYGSPMPWYYQQCFEFLTKHFASLTTISVEHDDLIDGRSPIWPKLIANHNLVDPEILKLLMEMDNVQVSELTLGCAYFEGWSGYQLGIRLLDVQTSLTSLRLSRLVDDNIAVWNAVPEALRQNAKTLRQVNISADFDPLEFREFSCSCLRNCKKLVELLLCFSNTNITDIEDLPRQIKRLDLGDIVYRNQIDFIVSGMRNLTRLYLCQTRQNSNVPKIDSRILKQVVSLPKLTTLTLKKVSCAYKRIQRMVSYTPGIIEAGLGENHPLTGSKTDYFELRMDRDQFDCNRL